MSVRGGSGFREGLRFMASASAVGDGAGEALARPAAIPIRIVPCAGREEAWGVHRIRGGSSQLPEVSCQIAARISRPAGVTYRKTDARRCRS
jgi:hypothetical protein